MSTSKRPTSQELFESMRNARHTTPLLREDDVVNAMHRTPIAVAAPRRLPVWMAVACAVAGVVSVGLWSLRHESGTPVGPSSLVIAPAPAALPPSAALTSTRANVGVVTQPHKEAVTVERNITSRGVRSHDATPAASARIAGLPFLDLSASEFAALPEGLQPEIRTQRVRTSNASGRVREQRTLECLTHSAQATSVIDNGEEYVQMSALYIPVRRIEQTSNGKVETVEWFKPTGDLISQLPERYRVPIMLELNLLTEVQRGCITPSEACRSLPHAQSYFDMCRLDASRIKDITIAPNPARTAALCTIDLRYSATIHLAAYTTSGAYVADLTEAVTLDPGVHEVSVPLNGMAPGMYLITTTTQDGEHVVRRLIVE